MDLKSKLRHVMNFPKEGIDYIDITTVLQDPASLNEAINQMKSATEKFGDFDLIVAPEARGFIFGVPLAFQLNKGFVPVRKKGKLPYKTMSMEYSLEYGTSILEMHEDAIKKGQKVVIVDDLMATSGTTEAIIRLVEKMGGQVAGIVIFVELEFLKGREKLKNYNVSSVVKL
ncbi:MAG: adenine phosphoribosyltransferase [Clostridia bacterium]|nr:adenine phosphoribosyltransferase [Tissierellales bacterium]MBN2851637.1 adenine phosphoribosyltransferase [Clostridia bacterium]